MKTLIPILFLLVAVLHAGCDQLQKAVAPTSISGVFVLSSEKRAKIGGKLGLGDMTSSLDFRSDGTVIKTFLGSDSRGTYSMNGTVITVSWKEKVVAGTTLPASEESFTKEGEDLVSAGERYIRKH